MSVEAILRWPMRAPAVPVPCEGGRRTVGGFRLVFAVLVLLARVCVGTRLGAWVLVPSDEVGLAVDEDGPGLVVDVEGGYRVDSFLNSSFCLEDDVPGSLGVVAVVLVPFSDLALLLEDVAMDKLRAGGLFTGSRLGEA